MKNTPNHVMLWSQISHLLDNSTGPCSLALKEGLANREKHPLPSGLYKLKDAFREIRRNLDEFTLLATLIRTKQPLVGYCTHGDQAHWIKQRPINIAYELGWKVLPAIFALSGDGVSNQEIKKHLPGLVQQIADLVNQCEKTLPQIKKPIRYEYGRWRNENSIITPLLESALSIIGSAIYITKDKTFA